MLLVACFSANSKFGIRFMQKRDKGKMTQSISGLGQGVCFYHFYT